MRLPGAAGLVVACLMAAPALAIDPPEPRDANAVVGCLTVELDRDGNGLACVGIVAEPCLRLPEAETNIGMQACYDRSLRAWDEALNRFYQALRERLSAAHGTRLRDAQRAWIAARDRRCEFEAGLFEGGSGTSGAHLSCLERETAIRAIDLWRVWRDYAR